MSQSTLVCLLFTLSISWHSQSGNAWPAVGLVPPVLEPINEDTEMGNWVMDANSDEQMEWMLMPGANGEVHVAVLTSNPVVEAANRLIRPTDIEFFLYTRENRDSPERAYFRVSCKPDFKNFDPKRPTKFLIHGFGDGVDTSLMYPILVDAYLDREDVNVFLVDWAPLAVTPWYKAAVTNTQYVGTRAARLIDHLVNTTGADIADFHIIGFSLGSHVAGIIGQRVTAGRIRRITGLDPASVLYGSAPPENRLDGTDADYVEVVHTSGGYLGYTDPIGQVDYFPNGGTWPQPGCYMDFVAVCSHRRAYYYFAEALKNGVGLKAVLCDSYEHFEAGNCTDERSLFLGSKEFPMEPDRARGMYFLETNSDEPYARNDDEAVIVRSRFKKNKRL